VTQSRRKRDRREMCEGTGGAIGNEEFRSLVLGIIAVLLSFPFTLS
jgi:hypothetical protein